MNKPFTLFRMEAAQARLRKRFLARAQRSIQGKTIKKILQVAEDKVDEDEWIVFTTHDGQQFFIHTSTQPSKVKTE